MKPGHSLLCIALLCSCGSPTPPHQGPRVDTACPAGCLAGEACTVKNNGTSMAAVCSPAGNVAVGADCSVDANGDSDCAPGALCTAKGMASTDPFAEPSQGVCRRYCATDADCAGSDDLYCWGFATNCDGDAACGARLPGGVCLPYCSPFSAFCGFSETCGEIGMDVDGKQGFLQCRPTGTAQPGEHCAQGDCDSDLVCLYPDGATSAAATCVPLCGGFGGPDCPAGQQCTVPKVRGVEEQEFFGAGLCQ